ncbi:hypothetical protein TWF192_000365 [Orbilia oligospora]|nr:hypothetical protein TWF192_000365 [Orbilia oligospora]
MHMKIFCQSYWGELHDLTFSYKRGSTKEPEEENAWETKFRQSLARPGTDEAAMMHTPLAAVVRYDTGNPTTHLFYISTGFKIREVIWKNGSQTNDCLGITVCPTSSLAVTKWGAGSQTHFRLYYQSKAGTIEEHCLDCNAGTWTKGATLSGPVSACDDDSPLRGTSLSFINLAQDKPELRGYFQTAKGSIQEFTYKGTKWSTSKIGVDAAPFRTPLAAITVEKNKIAALYYVDAYNRVNEVLWEGDWEGSERIDGESVAPGARLAVASLKYIGHDKIHMFSSGLVNNGVGSHLGESEPLLPTIEINPEGESGRSGFHPIHFFKVLWRSSNKVSSAVNWLWPLVPIAILARYVLPATPLVVFALTYIAMVPVANLLGFAGQEFARKLPKVSGILIETTFGSIVEIILFLTLLAKHKVEKGHAGNANMIPVIQAAILGSIITNLLLCLGMCFFVGGIRMQIQTFHSAVSEVGNGLLLVAGFGLLIPSAFYSALKGSAVPDLEFFKEPRYTNGRLQHDVLKISQATSILLIIAFIIYIWFNARTHHSIFDEVIEADEHRDLDRHNDAEKPKFTFTECILALAVSIALVTLFAIILVEKIEDVVEAGIPDQFLGLILLPLVEKAAEHLTAVDEAWDGQMNLALFHCLAPSIQTALFNAPLVVIVGWVINKPIDLNFEIFMITLLVLSILVTGNFLRDNECNYLEGALLVIIYLIMAVAAWYYPNPDVASSNGNELLGVFEAMKDAGIMNRVEL